MKIVIKLLFSISLLIFVLYKIDINKLFEILQNINIVYLFISFIFFNISKIISAIRLNYYFKEINIHLDFKTNLILYYIGMFYNLFLPGGIGGDGYKAYLLKKHFNQKLSLILQALLFDRISGLLGLIFLGGILFLFSSYVFFPLNILDIFIISILYIAFYIFSKKYNKFPKYLTQTISLGLIVQMLQLISALFIIFSLPQQTPILDFLVLFLISSVVSVLPISIGGIGVRELTFLYGLNYIGYNADIGIAFSFLFFFITLVSSLIGFLFIHKKLF